MCSPHGGFRDSRLSLCPRPLWSHGICNHKGCRHSDPVDLMNNRWGNHKGCPYPMCARPFMYGCNAAGIRIRPSACWCTSTKEINTRGDAITVLFSV